ncbi:MAG: YlbF family regulator [Gemmatimonadota bacterium]
MSKIEEMAKELGQALGRTDEYQALKNAAAEADEDRELVELRNELEKVEAEIVGKLRSGQEPDDEAREKYETLAEDLQVRPTYQKLAATQANFDKVLGKVNDTIAKGIQDGASSRIILPS